MLHTDKKVKKAKATMFSLNPLWSAMLLATASSIPWQSSLAAEHAIESNTQHYAVPAGSLSKVISQFSADSGIALSFDASQFNGMTSAGLQGRYSIAQGFSTLLSDTDVKAVSQGNKNYTLQQAADDVMMLDPVQIEGARIANADEGRFGDAPAELDGFKAEYQTTATKMAMSLRDTPQAITVITRDALDARQVKDLSTAVEFSAGISNSADGSGGIQGSPGLFGGQGQYDQKFVLRGQPIEVRGDGFRIGNSNVDFSAYERVEVVKGPSGFYGQGSLGGFINLIRKKPQEEFSASVSGQVGSFDTYRSEVDVTGALNETKSLRGRVTFAYEDADSFVDYIESERIVFAPSLEYIISDNTRVLTQFLYQKDSFDANPGIPLELVGDQLKPYDRLSSRTELYGVTGDKSETEMFEFLVRVDHNISDNWLTSLLLQSNKATRNIIEANSASVYAGSLYRSSLKDDWERDYWSGELRLEGSFNAFGQEHQLLLGAEHTDQHRTRDFGQLYPRIGNPAIFSGNFADYGFVSADDIPEQINRNRSIENSAIYIQSVLSLQEKTKLLIGGRYDKTKDHLTSFAYGSASEDGPRKDAAFTMRLGLTHEFTDNISAYAIYAESFEPTNATGVNGILDPITGEGYELGLKTSWFNDKLGATVAIYQQDLDNSPIIDPNDPTRQNSISAGLHRSEGIEMELVGSPYPGWTIAAAASWMDNEFTEEGDPNRGLSITGSIDNQFSLYANYEWQTGRVKGLGIGASFIKVGERQFISTSSSQMYLEGYERIDMNISYNALPNVDMSLLIRNVTDETYIESATRIVSGNYYGSPRAALLQVKYNFD